jgi:hypothetical protein
MLLVGACSGSLDKKLEYYYIGVFCNCENLVRGLLNRVLSLFLIPVENNTSNWTSDKRQFIFRMPIRSG